MSGHWSQGMLTSMKDPASVVISAETVVAIKDKYPKAKLHYLVQPFENISSIYHLNKSHQNLLNKMNLMAQNLDEINGRRPDDFLIGYHASPSMQRLHLHVLTKDFDSPCLKTKVHWNSFTTPFFLSADFIAEQLNLHGKVAKLPDSLLKEYMATELTCHVCDERLGNMPKLKQHIRTHFK